MQIRNPVARPDEKNLSSACLNTNGKHNGGGGGGRGRSKTEEKNGGKNGKAHL